MNGRLDPVVQALVAARGVGGGRPPEALNPGELMAVNEALGRGKRLLDAAYATVATEISRRSRAESGKESLAKRQGYCNSATLISATTGTSLGEAARIVAAGEATAPRMTLMGEVRPAKHPHVAQALAAGRIGMPASSAIITMLDRVAVRANPAALAQMGGGRNGCSPGRRSWRRGNAMAGVPVAGSPRTSRRSITCRGGREIEGAPIWSMRPCCARLVIIGFMTTDGRSGLRGRA